jgi:signal transduction histidine kinase
VKPLVRPARWLRGRSWAPWAFDAAVAVALFLAMLAVPIRTGPRGAYLACAGVACGAVLLRRRWPLPVLAVTCGATLASFATPGGPVAAAPVVALLTVAMRARRARAWWIGLATCALLTLGATALGSGPWYAQGNLALLAWAGMATAGGDAIRSRRAYVAAVEERAERAERTREEEARRRVAEERMRIARELHDVVAHHIALVNVQAGVAAHVMDARPDQAKQALAHVREASRTALDELRATVGLLRQSGDPEAPMEPAPGLAQLDPLLDGFRRAGLPVELTVTPPPDRAPGTEGRGAGLPPIPATVDLTAYRVIQESLTNTRKHAGHGATARVTVVVGRREVTVTVEDSPGEHPGGCPAHTPTDRTDRTDRAARGARPPKPRPAAPETAASPGGHGLLGMRERAAALGGSCEAAPRPEGGFRVHVVLPLGCPSGADRARSAATGRCPGTAAAAPPEAAAPAASPGTSVPLPATAERGTP